MNASGRLLPAIAIAVVFGFVLMNYSPYATAGLGGTKIQGYVFNNAGAPLWNVQVAMCNNVPMEQCTTPVATVNTDANGFYLIDWGTGGTFLLWANKNQVSAYWEELQYVSVNTGGGVRADFRLVDDQFTPVATLLMMFGTVNTRQTQLTLSWSVGASVSGRVDAYVQPIGGTATVTVGKVMSGSATSLDDPTINAQILQRGVVVHGRYWKSDPGHPITVYVMKTRDYWNVINVQADYMKTPPGNAERIIVPKKQQIAWTKNDGATFALRAEWSVSIGVSIEFVSFSTTLASFMVEGQVGVERSMTITIKNLTVKTHTYAFFIEGLQVMHVWQVG